MNIVLLKIGQVCEGLKQPNAVQLYKVSKYVTKKYWQKHEYKRRCFIFRLHPSAIFDGKSGSYYTWVSFCCPLKICPVCECFETVKQNVIIQRHKERYKKLLTKAQILMATLSFIKFSQGAIFCGKKWKPLAFTVLLKIVPECKCLKQSNTV